MATLTNKKRKPLLPWYRGFKGKIEELETNKFQFTGDLEIVNSTTIKITELPIGMYLDDIIKVLNKLKESDFIKDYHDDSVTTEYNITVTVPRTTAYLEKSVLLDKFKLISRDSQNLTAWLHTGKIRKFATVDDVISYFIDYRLEKYEQRRVHQLATMRHDQDVLMNKIRFIEYYLENSAAIAKKNKKELVASLEDMGFSFIDKLLDIKIYNLTADAIEAMENQLIDLDDEINRLDSTTAKDMYLAELQELKLEG
jgi:DNA topoisomerase-2